MMKALVVDDNKNDRMLLFKMLTSSGFEVMQAGNGVEAIEQVRKEKPDIIISDIMMPEMDGFMLLRALKENRETKSIPFLLYTASYVSDEDRELGLSLGASRFLIKPKEPAELLGEIMAALNEFKAGKLKPEVPAITEEEYLKKYSERIFLKLESKIQNLEDEIKKRKKTEYELLKLQEELEIKVKERTGLLEKEIAMHNKSEDKLRLQNEFTKLVIDSLTHPFYVINIMDYTISMANAAASVMGNGATCYAVSHKNNKPCDSIEHPCPLEEVKRTKKPTVVEHIHYDSDGNPRNVEVQCYPIFDSVGNVVQMIEYSFDITQRKQSEEKILKVNRIYTVISQINRAIVRSDKLDILLNEVCRIAVEYGTFQMAWIGFVDEKTNFVNPAAYSGVEEGYFSKIERISVEDVPEGCGLTGTAIRESRYYVCNDIEKDPRMDIWKEDALKRGYRSSIALPIKLFGKLIGAFTLYSSIPDFFDMEEINLLEEITNDISFAIESIEIAKKNKETESALLDSEERYRTLYDSSSDAIMLLDEKGFFDCNDATLRIFGFSKKEDFTKVHPSQVSPPYQPDGVDSLTAANNKITQAFRTGTNHFEWVHQRQNGEDFPADVLLTAFNFKGKQVLQATVRDITEQKRAEEELTAVRDEALRASAVKSEFLAKMSHELRTPLNAVMGFSQIMKMKGTGELNEKQERYVNNIFNSGKHLLGIISDMLDLVKIESGEELPLSKEAFSAPDAIEDAMIFVKGKAARKNITIKKEIDPELDIILADKLRFKQILLNLIDNAIKFSKAEGGTITILGEKINCLAQFSIIDTGIGIKEEEIGTLFELFHQIDSGMNRKYGGTGIGLAVSKQLVEQHGGRIWVESKYGEGSTFIFTLQLAMRKEENNDKS